MREALQTYDEYINSEVDWLGKIPKSWKISHVKRFCKKVTDGAHTSPDLSSPDFPFITVVNLDRGVLDFQRCLHTAKSDYEKLVRNGCKPRKLDILYSKDGTISETVVIDKDREFVVGSSFIILRPHLSSVNSKYISYLLSSPIMKYQARLYVKGAGLTRISIFNVGKLIAVLPSLKEQETIALYLDTKTAQIDRKIDLLTQKAKRYEELKRAIVNETVTGRRRIDNGELIMENDGGENCQLSTVNYPLYKAVNYPLYKDSAIEWIGEIPEHWKIEKIKRLTSVKRGASPRPIDDPKYFDDLNGEYGWVRIEDVTKSSKYLLETKEKLSTLGVTKSVKMKPGDIFLSIAGSVGKPIISKISCCIHDGFVYFVGLKQDVEFMFYIFNCKNIFSGLGKIGTQLNLNTEIVGGISIPLPPIEEQETIAHYLDTKTTHIDQIIQTINTQIEKLKELRKTLINDVVTGKIKIIDNGE